MGIFSMMDGKVGEILVKSRDLREQEIGKRGNLDGNQLALDGSEGYKHANMESVVIEYKRKRDDREVVEEQNGLDIMQLNENHQDMPKNLLLAGPGVQARQAL